MRIHFSNLILALFVVLTLFAITIYVVDHFSQKSQIKQLEQELFEVQCVPKRLEKIEEQLGIKFKPDER